MKRLILTVVVLVFVFSTPAFSQVAGSNINVLPLFSDPDDPDFFLKGDGYLQRQVEPTIAASTRNPDHLLAFFNDYRAVDIPDDSGLGEAEQIAWALKTLDMMMATVEWFDVPTIQPSLIAAAEAWVGMSRSYDGGLTWSGGMLPGGPEDNSPASLAAPIKGLEAATDPVLVPGPCGKFYLVFVAFTRGDQSKIVVARYEDLNNDEDGDPIVFQGMTVLESGNNADHGYFLDKPHINLDVWRGPGGPEECGHRLYVTYSTFNGFSTEDKIQSKMNFAMSEDGGLSFSTQKINKNWKQNQGSVIAIDPNDGTVYVFWRHFFDPDTIIMTKTTNLGDKWSNPKSIIGPGSIAAFDQPTVPSTAFYDPETLTARSNGFPTATVAADGSVYVAWQERVNISADPEDPAFGRPDELGSPRIVLTRSGNGGTAWSDREAVDIGDRDEPFDPGISSEIYEVDPPPVFPSRPSGPQIQPDLSFAGGRLMLAYLESRGLTGYATAGGTDPETGDWIPPEEVVQPLDLSPTNFASGYRRVMDVRAAVLNPLNGSFISTAQVSRYPIHVGADLLDGQQLADVAAINYPCREETADETDRPCTRQVNYYNIPQSGAGTSPFMGDYIDLVPTLQFVPDGFGGWRWATELGDTPYQGFHAIWADNRHLSPPTHPAADPEYLRYQSYGPPGIGGACFNPGSRNTDVLTSKVDASVIISAPTTYKLLNTRRGFPLSLRNPTNTSRFYRLTITDGSNVASFSLDPVAAGGDIIQGDVEIFAYSGISQVIYINPGAQVPVRVAVEEIDEIGGGVIDPDDGGQYGVVTLNFDPSNPEMVGDPNEDVEPSVGDAFVINPVPESAFVINDSPENAFVINPFVDNAFVINTTADNAFVINAFVINAFVINAFVINSTVYDVIDVTWPITSGSGDTAMSYLPLVNIDNAEQFVGHYAFQLIVSKNSSFGTFLGDDDICATLAAEPIQQQQVVSNVTQDPNQVDNAFVINPAPENAFVINPFPENAFVINSTFTMAPSEVVAAKSLGGTNDDTLKAAPASTTHTVTLRAYQLVKDSELGQFVYNPDPETGDTPALSIIPSNCDDPECIVSNAPDLVAEGVDTTPIVVQAGDSFLFPEWTLRNLGVNDAVAEIRDLRHGFFLSADDEVVLEALSDNPTGTDQRIGFARYDSNPVVNNTVGGGGGTQLIPATSVTVPIDVTPGDYTLVLYVDDYREVSEKNEPNNQVPIAITVEVPNKPPTVVDTSESTPEETAKISFMSASDPDVGDVLTYSILTDPTNGVVTLDDINTGAYTYTPDTDFNGEDSFTFEVSDGELTSESIGTVTINVTPVNDPPIVAPASVVVDEDGTATGTLDITDPDNDPSDFTYSVTTQPSNGEASFSETEIGTFVYDPDDDFNGTDSFTVTVSDGNDPSAAQTVTITITAVNDSPVVVDQVIATNEDTLVEIVLTATDVDGDALTFTVESQPANGSLSGSAPNLSYTPDPNFTGSDTFTFSASDAAPSTSGIATFTITVNPVNDVPVAMDDFATVNQNSGPNSIDVLLNDSDIDNDPIFVSAVEDGDNGTTATDGAFVTYAPDEGFVGVDTFDYELSDGNGGVVTATVTVTVIDPVPDWGFVGLLTPWRPNYSVKAGSGVPLKWYYTDPDTNQQINSSNADPEVRIAGPFNCNAGQGSSTVEVVEDTGSSDLRHTGGEWQLNWDTGGLEKGCYNIRIFSRFTDQINGPFRIRLR